MQLRWISIGVVCFSAALLPACGGAPSGTALTSRSDASAMSKADGRYDASSKGDDKDDCDESDHDKSADKSSLSVKSKDKDDDECKDSDGDHDQSKGSRSSRLFSMSSKYDGKDNDGKDKDDDENCKVTICHVPPGNHCNEHTIRVGKPAVRAHIAHGDYPGACDPQAPPPPPPPPPVLICKTLGDTTCVVDADCCADVPFCNPTGCSSTGVN